MSLFCNFYLLFLLCNELALSEYMEDKERFGGITMQCRDNENNPVDWWFIYKPAADSLSFLNDGTNFSFITSDEAGHWRPSKVHILYSAMLLDTMAPYYRETYFKNMAMVSYNSYRVRTNRYVTPNAMGLLMTDILGGFWLPHTMPGYPKQTVRRKSIPKREVQHGHLFMCVSLHLKTMNNLVKIIEKIGGRYNLVQIPPHFERIIPNWRLPKATNGKGVFNLTISSKGGQGLEVLYRTPGTRSCLYKAFAQKHDIILDVYGSGLRKVPNVCYKTYGLRTIEKISLKQTEQSSPAYIDRTTDRMKFAVSTAASWQSQIIKKNLKRPEYWTCFGNLDLSDMSGKAGLLICMNNYDIWISFDNFKISEPKCTSGKSNRKKTKKKTVFKKDF